MRCVKDDGSLGMEGFIARPNHLVLSMGRADYPDGVVLPQIFR